MVTFDKTTVKRLQNMHFPSKFIKLVLVYITIFDAIILEIKKTNKNIPSVEKWKSTSCVPLKKLLTEIQDIFPLKHTIKECYFIHLKKRIFKFQVVYMTSPLLK